MCSGIRRPAMIVGGWLEAVHPLTPGRATATPAPPPQRGRPLPLARTIEALRTPASATAEPTVRVRVGLRRGDSIPLCWSDGVVAAAGSTVDHGFPPGVTSRPRGAWSASHMLRGGMFAARRASVLDSSARPQLDLGRVWLCPPSIGPEASGSRLRGGSRPPSGRPSPRHAASGRPSVLFLSEVDGSCPSKDSLREVAGG